MHAAIHANHLPHQKHFGEAMATGLRRHGIKVTVAPFNAPVRGADFAVIWGWRQPNVAAAGPPVLVMERGTLHPREEWVTIGWNGLAGRGTYPDCLDAGERWTRHFGDRMEPWRCGGDDALILGQVPGDASIRHLDFRDWARRVADELDDDGYRVAYRPHPISTQRNDRWHPPKTTLTNGTLAADLAGASLAVTYNSGAGVDAVLAGVPTVTWDIGSMAWDVTSHDIAAHPVQPEREPWAYRLAWCQWTEAEIASGEAWAALRNVLT